jgi:hypothetical protein
VRDTSGVPQKSRQGDREQGNTGNDRYGPDAHKDDASGAHLLAGLELLLHRSRQRRH